MNQNQSSIQHHTPTDTGILAVALRALAGFSPALVPSGKNSQAVIATCPVCIGEPGSLGSLRVEAVDVPKRLNWHCSLHRGGFNGVAYALSKHQSAQVSNLRHTELPICSKLDTLPDRDPLPDHQADLRCTDPRRIVLHGKKLKRARLGLFRCNRCLACRYSRKARRISDLKGRVEGWATVRRTPALAAKPFAALSRRLRRHGCEYVAVPVDAGRIILTNSALEVGDVIAVADIAVAIEGLIRSMLDAGRVSGTVGTRKAKKRKEIQWERIGSPKLDDAAFARVCSLHGCPSIERARENGHGLGRGLGRAREWDVSGLSPDKLLALWMALGIRITKRVRAVSKS